MAAATPPRVAVGALLFEGNTLSPCVNTVQDFRNKYFESGEALTENLRAATVEVSGALRVLEAAGAQVVPLFATHGGAGGRVAADAYAELKERLLAPLRGAGPVDGVYLALHGAMVCEGEDDPEGDILAAVRGIVGDAVPVAVSCDLHAHVTPRMMALADIIIGYQLYPHDDTVETGERCARLLLGTVAGEIRPVMRLRRAPMIVPAPRQRTAGDGPLARCFAWAREREAAGEALAVSYFPTQPWLDLPEVGFTALAITDGDAERADAVALALARQGWELREDFQVPLVPPAEAIRQGLALPQGPVILADTADCVGGGGSGDSAVVLRALLEAAPEAPACILIVDPETVQAAEAAGVGGRFAARIGNKLNPDYGPPVEAEALVERLFAGDFTYSGGILSGGRAAMGPSAVLRVGAVQVVVSTYSSYEYADEQFRAAGIDPWACRFVVVKNPMNYQTAYAGAPAMVVLDTPGPTTCDLAAVPWQRVTRPRWPMQIDFQPTFAALAGRR